MRLLNKRSLWPSHSNKSERKKKLYFFLNIRTVSFLHIVCRVIKMKNMFAQNTSSDNIISKQSTTQIQKQLKKHKKKMQFEICFQ